MTTKEEAQKLYEGKFFYEIVDGFDPVQGPCKMLFGPFDNIYYVHRYSDNPSEYDKYEFLQVIDGTPKVAFTKEQILVTDRRL